MIHQEILEAVEKINEELIDSDFTTEEIKQFWDDCIEEARQLSSSKDQQIPIYSFFNLEKKLEKMALGDYFKIKGDRSGNWVFYTETEGYYFIKHNTHKQVVLIRKE